MHKNNNTHALHVSETELQRAKAEAKHVEDFLNTDSPDFLSNLMLTALDRAFEHFGLPRPEMPDDQEVGNYNAENLEPLFLKTKLLSWDEISNDREPDYVTVTLPNGRELELYGAAADEARKEMDAHPDWIRLANAIEEICSNPATPADLKNLVYDFLHSNSGDIWGKLIVTPPMIVKILVHSKIAEENETEVSHA
ncbi:MAG: hypothetical protein ACR2HX_19720 [Pyrinomonadaceae bacterium]